MRRVHRQGRTFPHRRDLLGQHPQHIFGALKRRLVIGNVDILAGGGQTFDGGAQQRHFAAELGERPRRAILTLPVVLIHACPFPNGSCPDRG